MVDLFMRYEAVTRKRTQADFAAYITFSFARGRCTVIVHMFFQGMFVTTNCTQPKFKPAIEEYVLFFFFLILRRLYYVLRSVSCINPYRMLILSGYFIISSNTTIV